MPDGKRILSGGADGRVMAWEPHAAVPDQLVHFSDECHNIEDLDGDRFLLSGLSQLMLCDRAATVLQKIGPWHHWRIVAAAAPARLVFAANRSEVLAWNVDTGKQVFHWPTRDEAENITLAATLDGRTVCITVKLADGSRNVQIVDAVSGGLVEQLLVRSANHLGISPDGRWLVFDSNNDVQLYDLEKRTIAETWRGHQAAIRDLKFSHDGRRLGSVSADRTLKLWSVPSGEIEYSVIAHRTDTVGLAFAPDGRRIATAGKDRTLRLWDGQNAEPLWEHPVITGEILDLCFSADGQQLVCLGDEHHLLLLDGSPIKDCP